jgi:hypothetical protein
MRVVFCGAGVSPAIFLHSTRRKNRRRDAGATKYASTHEFDEMYFADRIRYYVAA